MSSLSRLSKVLIILVLLHCLVELIDGQHISDFRQPRLLTDPEDDNIIYVEARSTFPNFKGRLNFAKGDPKNVVFTIEIHEDITDNKSVTVGPAWEPRMSVYVYIISASDYRVSLRIEDATCTDNYVYFATIWLSKEEEFLTDKIIFLKSLSPSTPKIINPYGVQLKENQNHTFVCTASTGFSKEETLLHWQVTVGKRSFVLSRVHSIFYRGVTRRECFLNSTLTLKIKQGDQGLFLRCLLTSPNHNTIKQADKISDCAQNRWCDVTEPFDIACKIDGRWKVEHCGAIVTETEVYFVIPLAISVFLNLLCCYLCSRRKTKKEQPEDNRDTPEIASHSSKAKRKSLSSHLNVPEIDLDGYQPKSVLGDPSYSKKKVSLIRSSVMKVIGVFHKPVVAVKSNTSLFSEHSHADSSVDGDD